MMTDEPSPGPWKLVTWKNPMLGTMSRIVLADSNEIVLPNTKVPVHREAYEQIVREHNAHDKLVELAQRIVNVHPHEFPATSRQLASAIRPLAEEALKLAKGKDDGQR